MFHNEELNRIFEEAQPVVKAHLDDLDFISRDIKCLESIMKGQCIPSYMTMVDESDSLEWDGSRINYYVLGVGRPLIETKVFFRIKASKHLDRFFKSGLELINKGSEQ